MGDQIRKWQLRLKMICCSKKVMSCTATCWFDLQHHLLYLCLSLTFSFFLSLSPSLSLSLSLSRSACPLPCHRALGRPNTCFGLIFGRFGLFFLLKSCASSTFWAIWTSTNLVALNRQVKTWNVKFYFYYMYVKVILFLFLLLFIFSFTFYFYFIF